MDLRPLPFTLRQLQYAVAVADAGSFRAAARACRVSQPALSTQLAELEAQLGAPLFERSRPVRPTTAGDALLARARVVLSAARELVEAASSFGDPLSGTLRIGVIPTVGPYLLPEIAPALRAAFPRLQLRWIEEKTPVLLERLAAGELDAALLAAVPETAALRAVPVGEDPFVLVAAREHPLAQGRGPIGLDGLGGAPLLLLEEGHCFRDHVLEACAATGSAELGFRATSLSTLVQMVAAGAGVTLLPAMAVPVEGKRARVRCRPVRGVRGREIVLAWRPTSPLGDALARLGAVMAQPGSANARITPSGADR